MQVKLVNEAGRGAGIGRRVLDVHARRRLVLQLVQRTWASRYRQSILGPLWAIGQPVALFALLTMVGTVLDAPGDGGPYAVFVAAGLTSWAFFANGVSFAAGSIVQHAAILKKVRVPLEIFPLSATLLTLVDLVPSFALFVVVALGSGESFSFGALWAVPLLALVGLLAFALGAALSVVAAHTRDVAFGVPLVLQFWLYACPVMYGIDAIDERWRRWYLLNPMAGLIHAVRRALLDGAAPSPTELWPSAIGFVVLVVGALLVFRAAERDVVDVV